MVVLIRSWNRDQGDTKSELEGTFKKILQAT